MSPADFWVLGATIAAFLTIMLLHERREFRRQDGHEKNAEAREVRAVERHAAEMRAIDHNRALTLSAIDQRNRLDARVVTLEAKVKALEGL